MRSLVVLLLVALAGCPATSRDAAVGGGDNGAGSGSGSGAGGGAPAECFIDGDCVPMGPKCCDCPTYAVPKNDPAHVACESVMCPASTCPANVHAACDMGRCVLACSPMACDMSCADGYATDPATGCLTCACAAVTDRACFADTDCARTRADCCGCAMGGTDTSVLASQVAAYDASLMCPANPSCPGGNSCQPDLAPHCVQGACELDPPLPPGACGRPDLPACPTGQVCTVNASAPASAQGVGVCM